MSEKLNSCFYCSNLAFDDIELVSFCKDETCEERLASGFPHTLTGCEHFKSASTINLKEEKDDN